MIRSAPWLPVSAIDTGGGSPTFSIKVDEVSTLVHTSNLYYHPLQAEAAARELAAGTAASLMAVIVWFWFGLPLTRRAEDERSDDAHSG